MGQRHQVFIHMPSPLKGLKEKYESIKKHDSNNDDIRKLRKQIKLYEDAFGKNEFTTTCWHHQWLYGRSALLTCLNVLSINCNSSNTYNNPFHIDSDYQGEERISLVSHILGMFNNKLAQRIGRCGVEKFHILNFNDPRMRTDCKNYCDNNDGITIIDTTKNAYAFVNIGTGDSTVKQLPEMEPCTAEQYLRLYYPQDKDDSSTVNLPDDLNDQEVFYKTNLRINRIFLKLYQPYRLLTRMEIMDLFPASFNA